MGLYGGFKFVFFLQVSLSDFKPEKIKAGSRYFCESLFWVSQPKQAAKT
ncbi:hypothetical protein BAZMOX_19223_1 [methanotrophic endosymbiont of Bathymodiolus azoricus (Menez Gwen)]|nr:hypothetical protein BAZMOX_19223_1 [methanotrophic endosymbiont of Bathymodiolus azoricus (Menez Gwen)]